MRIVLLGAGLQAQAAGQDVVAQDDVSELVVADADEGRARALVERLGDARARAVALDCADVAAARKLLEGTRATLSAVPYRFNAGLAQAAVEAGSHFCDLGGNNDVVARELALDAQARAAGVTVVPDCGLAPGLVSMLTADAAADFEALESVQLRVGGIPAQRGGPLDYSLVFNMQGLINEYVEDAVVLRDGEPVTVPSLDDFEELEFPEPFGRLEAFTTSGGTSTLPQSYRGQIPSLDYKTIRYPGHGRVFAGLKTLGLLGSDEVEVGGARVRPRDVVDAVATPVLDRGDEDVILLRATAVGTRDGARVRRVYQLIEEPADGLTAMMRCTAYPATTILLMLARGEVPTPGALPQERCVDPKRFLEALRGKGIGISVEDQPA